MVDEVNNFFDVDTILTGSVTFNLSQLLAVCDASHLQSDHNGGVSSPNTYF